MSIIIEKRTPKLKVFHDTDRSTSIVSRILTSKKGYASYKYKCIDAKDESLLNSIREFIMGTGNKELDKQYLVRVGTPWNKSNPKRGNVYVYLDHLFDPVIRHARSIREAKKRVMLELNIPHIKSEDNDYYPTSFKMPSEVTMRKLSYISAFMEHIHEVYPNNAGNVWLNNEVILAGSPTSLTEDHLHGLELGDELSFAFNNEEKKKRCRASYIVHGGPQGLHLQPTGVKVMRDLF